MATIIRVHKRDALGRIRPEFEPFNLYDFGGHPPQVGDLIFRRAAGTGATVVEPEVWEVQSRYHDPGTPFDSGACLRIIVRARPPEPDEDAL